MEKITITRKTAETVLKHLWDYYQEIYYLDQETRAAIKAIDELALELDAEDLLKQWETEQREAAHRAHAEYMARKEAAESGKN